MTVVEHSLLVCDMVSLGLGLDLAAEELRIHLVESNEVLCVLAALGLVLSTRIEYMLESRSDK
jgi:hypothetical protein